MKHLARRTFCGLALSAASAALSPVSAKRLQAAPPIGSASEIQTGVFGLRGKGSKFIYVFDRSGSMGEFEGRPLARAKRELLASLEALDSVHQFQIIFYNDRLSVVNPNRQRAPRLLFGSETDKGFATDFVRGITPAGGSGHLAALQAALRLHPDVIFFLTDAGEPVLTAKEQEAVRKLNADVGAVIHTIEFGVGADSGKDNFLRQIAREHRGEHVYVDISRLKD